MAPLPSTIGPAYKGSRLRIPNPAAGRASRNWQSLVPRGYKAVENHGDYIVVERVDGPTAPPGYDVRKTGAENAAAAQKKAADQKAPTAAANKPVWLDGKLVTVTIKTGPDGTETYTATPVDGSKAGPAGTRPSAFGALDSQSIDPTSPFLMNRGATRPPGFMGPVAESANHMTVSGGVQWLAQLSTKDPGAYQAMLTKLYNAGYLSKQALNEAAGHWSAAAGQAFALAARDTAVVNTTEAGLNTTLDDFLQSKAGAAAAAEAASGSQKQAYQPVDRKYTDPEDLKANAKSVAEKVLGRQLTAAEEGQLVGHFRSLEDATYNQIDAAGRAQYDNPGAPGATVTPPGQGQIDAFVDSPEHAAEANQYRAAEYGLALKQLFGLR